MNKPNHCWRCEAICTQQCSRCRVAYYCSKECQKQDKWRHQPECETAALKLQCSACDIEQEGLMKCTNCLKACYCSTECQRSDWKRHKTFCHDAVDKTLKLVQRMKEFHEMKKDNTGLGATYYWGNIPAVDLLNLSMNEGEEYSNSLALLLSRWSKECSTYNCFVTWSLYPASQLCFKWHLSLHIGQNRSASIYVI